ncbi:unnamed protein product [Durusdinium trenchii]|uniref:EF-hand domain-containing protein n=1 Tax=Durusdinium trenchii TaxID=1381693 RepID=A0ABP0HMD2_9DINO
MPQLDFSHGAAPFTDNDIHAQIAITKELFLLVIQDRCVQRLMDELDLPPDRANLFEAIDADGSGTLHVTELVQGLLQIRGEVKKSDAVATLLSTKALQNMVTEMREELNANMEHLQDFIKAEIQTCLDLRHGMHGPPPKSLMRQSLAQLVSESSASPHQGGALQRVLTKLWSPSQAALQGGRSARSLEVKVKSKCCELQ